MHFEGVEKYMKVTKKIEYPTVLRFSQFEIAKKIVFLSEMVKAI